MATKSNILLFVIMFLIFTSLFTSIQSRKLKVPKHRHHHKSMVVKNSGKVVKSRYEQVLVLRGIKSSGPSPGEGHSSVNGAHN
uniref:Transmembrane protein n=1 Tax=Lactuca sativa TaxID=4236 RepID=A0A9R1W2B9_LACSA|nr:hypothetical protein LSAT_V11C300141320 [Lactuca sativa]